MTLREIFDWLAQIEDMHPADPNRAEALATLRRDIEAHLIRTT
jgi:hypothetical protein